MPNPGSRYTNRGRQFFGPLKKRRGAGITRAPRPSEAQGSREGALRRPLSYIGGGK